MLRYTGVPYNYTYFNIEILPCLYNCATFASSLRETKQVFTCRKQPTGTTVPMNWRCERTLPCGVSDATEKINLII